MKNSYICPLCGNKQNKVLKVVETLEYWELDLETREVGDCLDEENRRALHLALP